MLWDGLVADVLASDERQSLDTPGDGGTMAGKGAEAPLKKKTEMEKVHK